MHESVRNEKKEMRARPRRQTRTGPTDLEEQQQQQQKRIAARAASAMAQVLQRRREQPRSLLMWGDRKKAIVKSYPDGGQEIIVPQTLTAEQEQYEFPPRSRFLKKLATSTAKRNSVLSIENDMKQPDQLSLKEWFSKKEKTTSHKVDQSNRAVIEWMDNVERHSGTLLVKVKPSPTCSANKIQFKSDAGKRWANSITANTSLLPPDDHCRKHYVPRRLLISTTKKDNMNATDAASKIQTMWKEYQAKHHRSTPLIENQIGMTAMASTGQRTPMAGMVHILEMLQTTLKQREEREQRDQHRLEQLENLLKEERHMRQYAEEKLESTTRDEKIYQTLLHRVAELEDLMKREGQSKKELQEQLIQATKSNASLKKSLSRTMVPPSLSSRKSSTKPSSTLSRKTSTIVPSTPLKTPSVVPSAPSSRKPSIVPSPFSPSRKSSAAHSRKSSVVPAPSTRSTARTSSLANAGVARTSSLANAGVVRSRVVKK